MGNTCTLRPCLQVEPPELPVRGELPEPLQGREPTQPPVWPGRVRALVEAPVPLDQLREGPTARHAVELLPVDSVTPLGLPVQVRAPEPDGAAVSFLLITRKG